MKKKKMTTYDKFCEVLITLFIISLTILFVYFPLKNAYKAGYKAGELKALNDVMTLLINK